MSISLEDGLKEEMDAVKRPTNWSAIAASAFRQHLAVTRTRTTKSDMNAVIERMKAAQEQEDQQRAASGHQQGRDWAMNHAKPSELRRLAAASDELDFSDEHPRFHRGDLLVATMRGGDATCIFVEEFIDEEIYGHLGNDEAFVTGFMEGCLEVWEEVKDEL